MEARDMTTTTNHDRRAGTCTRCHRSFVACYSADACDRHLRACAEGEGGRAALAVQGYANAHTAYYFAKEAAHYARLLLRECR
jgi:hypothetical protein